MIVHERTTILELEGSTTYAGAAPPLLAADVRTAAWTVQPVGGGVLPLPPAEVRALLADVIESEAFLQAFYPTSPLALVDWHSAIEGSGSVQSLLALLRLAGLDKIAQRLADLSEPGDALEEDEEPASLDSIKAFALSIRDFLGLGEPLIGLSEDETLVAEWRIAPDKHIAIKFVQIERIAFALIAPGRARLSGTGSLAAAFAAICAYGVEQWRSHEG